MPTFRATAKWPTSSVQNTQSPYFVDPPDKAAKYTAKIETKLPDGTVFQKGVDFAAWLKNVGASVTQGEIEIQAARKDVDATVVPGQRWIYTTDPLATTVQHYTFNTPVGAAEDKQCGRTVFSDFHVSGVVIDPKNIPTFPAECDPGPLTSQEKILEFMLFDLASCVQPDTKPPRIIIQ